MTLDVAMVDAVVNATGVAAEAAKAGHDGHWNSKPAWKLPGWGEPVVRLIYRFLLISSSRFLFAPICTRVSQDKVEKS